MNRKTFIIQSSKTILGTAVMSALPPVRSPFSGPKQDGLTLFLCGDVMTGRGIDQVLPYSVDPRLRETHVKDAREYVRLAEQASGDIPDEVSYRYIWGDALEVLEQQQPDARIINLETAVTTSDEYRENKSIHYRMHPSNTPLLAEAGIDVCVLGNNHTLDWGTKGLQETLQALQGEEIQTAGAGENTKTAEAPAEMDTGSGRLLVFSYATPSAGSPESWSAGDEQPGVNLLPEISPKGAKEITHTIRQHKQEEDRVVLSIHWGGNWGYDIPKGHREFAHQLIDNGAADIIHGHSSHHPKAIEIYKGQPILYGCGDLINDYEGISGHEEYRGDLSLMYFPRLDSEGKLRSLEMTPMQIHRFQLHRPSEEDVHWLRDTLRHECGKFGHRVDQTENGSLVLQWEGEGTD